MKADREIKVRCSACGHLTRIPTVTNADRIRSMTDEELAEWMSANVANYARRKFSETGVIEKYGENGLIAKSWLDWLREEASND